MKQFYLSFLFIISTFFVVAQTGTSTEVGITEGQLSVSLSGSATYSVPIAVPPGINGVVPQVDLVYNSQSGNGIAGYGWNISGISSITRIPATKFHDGTIDAVDFDALDRFAFDGQRLMIKSGTSGTYGANGTVYETENFSNVKITSYGVHPSGANYGPSYFIVEYPDGSKAYYGNSTDSRTIMNWSITYWENPQGVRISYAYNNANNNLNIATIKYGTLGAATPINIVQFNYVPAKRPEQGYVGGLSVTNNTILDNITITGNGLGYRSYWLAYEDTSLLYQRLVKITEKSGDLTKSYNPTLFTYYGTTEAINAAVDSRNLSVSTISTATAGTVTGDFDGNGYMDILLYPTTGTYAKKRYYIFPGDNYSGSVDFGQLYDNWAFDEIFPVSFLSANNFLNPFQGWVSILGNTFTTLALAGTGPVQQDQKTYAFSRFVLDYDVECAGIQSQQLISVQQSAIIDPDPGTTHVHYETDIPRFFISGDFNGDGLTDIAAIEKSFTYPYQSGCATYTSTYTGGKTFFVNLDRRVTSNFTNNAGTLSITNNSIVRVGDFNGDGKSDIYVFDTGTVKIYGIDDNKLLTLLFATSTTDSNIVLDKTILMGDYNGDGKTDFIIPQAAGSAVWYKYSATGTNFYKETQTYSGFSYLANSSTYTYNVIPTDYNNDGKTDLLLTSASRGSGYSVGSLAVTCFVNKNGTFSGASGNFYNGTISNHADIYPDALPVFLSSDKPNRKLELRFINNNKLFKFNSAKDFSTEQLLKTVTTGNNVTETISYQPLSPNSRQDNYSIYSRSNSIEVYPNMDIAEVPSLQVVTKLEKTSNAGTKKQMFSYFGGVSNVEGRGFLGFRATGRTNWFDVSSSSISTISLYDISLRGANTENYSVLGIVTAYGSSAPSTFITKSLLSYTSSLGSNKVFNLKNTTSQQFNGLENTSTETTNVFDAYNNPTQSTTLVKQAGVTQQTTVSNLVYDNLPTGTPYVIGRPNNKKQTVTVTGDTMSSEEQYTYTNSLLTQIKKLAGTDYITENNVYDTYGNITQKTITYPGLTARVTSYVYDTTGRFLTKSTDIEGLYTTYLYNTDGTLKSETNPYNLTTSYGYDVWFKKIKTTDYLGKNVNYVYTRNGVNTTITTTGDDGNVSEEIFDDLGRKTRSGSKDITGTFSYVSYQYDIYDRKVKVSEPYTTSATQWNESQYDVYGRLKTSISFTGKTVSMTYTGLVTKVDDGIKTKESTKNGIGNVVSMKDTPGGIINYTYFANGNLKNSEYGGVNTTIEQDVWGRKTKLTDPSAGVYTYTYNGFGENLTETTPNGTTTYTLNAVGKPTQKTIVGTNTNSKTTYIYDGTTKLLTSSSFVDISENNATTTTTYAYDSSKRLSGTTEVTPYATFVKQITYDAFGRVLNETSNASANGKSSNKIVQHTYKNGQSWQIIDTANSQVLWQTNTVNARGQLTGATMANGNIGITNAYDSYGFMTQTKQDRLVVSPGNIMTLNTVFDAQRGNLSSRTNSLFGWSESFIYDSLDRLTSFENTAGVTETQNYDDRGRITQNAVGTYNYTNSSKVYQSTSVTLTPAALTYYQGDQTQNISYNAFKSPYLIEEVGKDKISFTYNDSNDRSTMFYGNTDANKLLRPYRKYYSAEGSMEIKHNIQTGAMEFVTYIGGDGYTAPLAVKSDGTTQNYLYLQRDYQGSIVAVSDPTGNILEKRLFDAWGNVLVQNGAGTVLNGLTILDRGYTGHEHLNSVGLIHMNGRLYDPKLHRFLQPDNNIQDPYNTQNYNRYGYVLNNPLKYTDPSGEFWNIVIGAAIGGIVNWAAHGCQFNAKGLAYFGVGAVAGALTAMGAGGVSSLLAGGSFSAGALGTAAACSVGSGFMSSAVVGAAGGLVGGFTSGFGNSLVDGKNIGDCLKNGIRDGGIGAITGGVIGGIAGGIDAALDGRDFWTGAGESIDYVKVPSNTVCTDEYSSNAEMRADYNSNIGSRDGISLSQAESKIGASVNLGQSDNLPKGWSLNSDGEIFRGKITAGGITVRNFSGGVGNRMTSNIYMSPSVKGYNLYIKNMMFKHEFMHAWHWNSGFSNWDGYSERATSLFSEQYVRALGQNSWIGTWKGDIGWYPSSYSWINFNKIIPLWIK